MKRDALIAFVVSLLAFDLSIETLDWHDGELNWPHPIGDLIGELSAEEVKEYAAHDSWWGKLVLPVAGGVTGVGGLITAAELWRRKY